MQNIDINNLLDSVNIKVINKDTRFWLVRTQGGLFYDEFVQTDFIAIAWNYLDKKKLDNDKSEKDIKRTVKKLEDKYENVMKRQGRITKGQGRRAYNKSERFINELKVGDIVMIPSCQSTLITFAKVGGYFEIDDFDFEKEMEVMSDIIPGVTLTQNCPYKKRRKIEVLKTVNSRTMNPNLFKALVSYHGLSNIDDFGEFILSSIYDSYYHNKKINCVFNLKQKNGIDAIELSNFIYNFSSLFKIDNQNTMVNAKLNLNSPGEVVIEIVNNTGTNIIDFINTNKFWIIFGWLSITGGSLGPVKFEGILNYLFKFRETQLEQEKLNLEKDKFLFEKYKFDTEHSVLRENSKKIKNSSDSLKIDESRLTNIIDLSKYFSKTNKSNDDETQ